MVKSNKEREEKQHKRNKMLLSILIVILMVGSTIGFFIGGNQDPNKIEYEAKNGKTYTFDRGSGVLVTKIDKTEQIFYNYPTDVEKINFSQNALTLIKNAQVLGITFDPTHRDVQFFEQTRFDLTKDFASFQKYVVPGITKESEAYKDFMIITCDNSSVQAPVIEFVSLNTTTETRVYVTDNSCIIFEGRKYDFLKFRDYITYKMNGLI